MFSPELEQVSASTPEQRLIAAVVGTALKDSCIKPFKPFGEKHYKLTFDCMTAHDFLWTESLESYLHYLDIDVEFFRKSLLKTMANDSEATIGLFSHEQRRAFRFNKRLWDAMQSGGLVKSLADPESSDWHSVDPPAEQTIRRVTKDPAGNNCWVEIDESVSETTEGV